MIAGRDDGALVRQRQRVVRERQRELADSLVAAIGRIARANAKKDDTDEERDGEVSSLGVPMIEALERLQNGDLFEAEKVPALAPLIEALEGRCLYKKEEVTSRLAATVRALAPLIKALKALESGGTLGADDAWALLKANTSKESLTIANQSWLHHVCRVGDNDSVVAVLKLLKRSGVKPWKAEADSDRSSPLHVAARSGRLDVVKSLIEYGFDQQAKNKYSEIPGEVADMEGHGDVILYLENVDRLPEGTLIKANHEGGTDTGCEIVEFIASGSFGHVFKVRHLESGQFLALKIVKKVVRRTTNPKSTRKLEAKFVDLLKRQLVEADQMLKIGLHPNVVSIRRIELLRNVRDSKGDSVTDNLYVLMDYVENGRTLFDCRRILAAEDVARLILDVARGLAHVESKGVVHWDLKPENVLVAYEDVEGQKRPSRAMISDFGEAPTSKFASKETKAYFDAGRKAELRAAAAKTQHLWSWATLTMDMVCNALNLHLKSKYQWENHEEALAVFERLKSTVDFQDQPILNVCLELCGKCLKFECRMSDVVTSLEIALKASAEIGPERERDLMELCLLHASMGSIFKDDLTQSDGDYDRAEHHLKRASAIAERLEGDASPLFATSLNNLAGLLYAQGKYDEAKPLYERAIEIGEKTVGPNHPAVATRLNNLAQCLSAQGKYDEAKPLYERAIEIDEKTLGSNHPGLATDLNNLAQLLRAQGKYDEAKPLFERSLEIRENSLGKDHPAVAESLNNLAELLSDQGKYDEAKPLYERAIEIDEKTLGPDHPNLATSLNNLAGLLESQGKYDEAKPLYERAIEIGEKTVGPDHPQLATWLNNLALLLNSQGKYDEAKPLYERVIKILEKSVGEGHPNYATGLNNLARLLRDQGKYDEAKPLFERSLGMREKTLGKDHPAVATTLNNLAGLLSAQGQYDEADPIFRRSLDIRAHVLGQTHPDTITSRAWIADNLQKKGDYDAALPILREVVVRRERAQGKDHPDLASALNNLAQLLSDQDKYDEARPLHDRALEIRENSLGKDHPDVAQSLNNLAGLLESQGKYDEAKPLYDRALEIDEKVYGKDHPEVATDLNNLARVLSAQGQYDEADPMFRRAYDIQANVLGRNHPHTITSRAWIADNLQKKGDFDAALPILREVVVGRERAQGKDHPSLAKALNNLAWLLSDQGQHREALRHSTRAVQIAVYAQGMNHRRTKRFMKTERQIRFRSAAAAEPWLRTVRTRCSELWTWAKQSITQQLSAAIGRLLGKTFGRRR